MEKSPEIQDGVYVCLLAWLVLLFAFVKQALVVFFGINPTRKTIEESRSRFRSLTINFGQGMSFVYYVSLKFNKLSCIPKGVSVA